MPQGSTSSAALSLLVLPRRLGEVVYLDADCTISKRWIDVVNPRVAWLQHVAVSVDAERMVYGHVVLTG
jgi:hypothetical protein